MSFEQVTIVGPGLMGGSLVLALSESAPMPRIKVWARRDSALTGVLAAGTGVEGGTDLVEMVRGSSLVILCTPIETMGELALTMRGGLAPGAVVTDVGSVKTGVVDAVRAALPETVHYISSHPMAGSERDGFEAARADLYRNAPCILTRVGEVPGAAAGQVEAFWAALGMRTFWMDAAAHDAAVAAVSHLPHVLAAALVHEVAANAQRLAVTGSGWRDMTRVASGATGLWTEILRANRAAVADAVESFAVRLLETARHLRAAEMAEVQTFLETANRIRGERYPERDHG